MNIGGFLNRLRGMSTVYRWNFHTRITQQTVGEHSFYVAIYSLLIVELSSELTLEARMSYGSQVMAHALFHDVEEAVTGDLPTLVKREIKEEWKPVEMEGRNQLFKFLSAPLFNTFHRMADGVDPYVKKIVKAADLLDALMYARHEKSLGNSTFNRIEAELVTLLFSMCIPAISRTILPSLGYERDPQTPMTLEMTHL